MNGFSRRSWLKAKDIILQHKRVVVGDGNSTNFWIDNWIGDHRLIDYAPSNCSPNTSTTVQSFFLQQSTTNHTIVEEFVPDSLKSVIHSFNLSQYPDLQAWSLSSTGMCTVASTYRMLTNINPNHHEFPWTRLWYNWLPTKISFLLWKIVSNALPTDNNVQRVGVHLCSKCLRCKLHCE